MKAKWFIGLLALWLVLPLSAQDATTLLALRTETTDLQTGEFYTIRVEIDNVTELWAATMTINYNPQQLYIVGTKSGSPVQLGDFLSGGAIIIQNEVDDDSGFVRYTPSRLAPADGVSGNGVIGTFQIVPLQAGEATLTFGGADMSRAIFATNDDGQRLVEEAVNIPFVVSQLTLSITGDPATPPPEATATPTPTVTAIIDTGLVRGDETEVPDATLAVVTDVAPTAGASTETSPPAETTGVPLLLIIAVALIVIALVGLIILFVVMRRNRAES